jgi:hypothetical protein
MLRQICARREIGQLSQPCLDRCAGLGHPAIGRSQIEGVRRRREAQDDADRTRRDLAAYIQPVGDHEVDAAEGVAPAIGGGVGLLDGDGNLAAGGASEMAVQPQFGGREIVAGGDIGVEDDLDHALARPPQRGGDPAQFALRGPSVPMFSPLRLR